MSKFAKATKKKSKLRFACHGGSGFGKTKTVLEIAKHFGGRVVLLDTEEGSASKYSDQHDFDVLDMRPPYHPNRLIEFLKDAADEKYDIVIIDSLTHFWNAEGGMLELVDQEAKRNTKGNSFTAWKAIDPLYRKAIQAILQSPCHVLACIRSKMDYVQVKNENTGKMTPQKVGMAPEFRGEVTFEFDVEGSLNENHDLIIGKTRCPELDGRVFNKAGKEVADILRRWLEDGVEPTVMPAPSGPSLYSFSTENMVNAVADEAMNNTADILIAQLAEADTQASAISIWDQAKVALVTRGDLLVSVKGIYAKRYQALKPQVNGAA